MYSKRIIIGIKRSVGSLLVLICISFTSCNSEMEIASIGEEPVQIASVCEKAITKASAEAVNGTYYLGYKEGSDKLKAYEIAGGTFVTGLYWANMYKESQTQKAFFTLSNMEEDLTTACTAGKDVVWGSTSKWIEKLSFVLSHQMAQVKVELKNDLTSVIHSVSITSVKQSYTFDRKTGMVTPSETVSELMLKKDGTDNTWSVLLPPQARENAMELVVVTEDQKIYKRKLPYSMSENIGENNTQSVVLKFRSGYRLNLSAKLAVSDVDYTIYFTGATLQNWDYKGSHSVVAKPAGIYTLTDLKDWATKYNAYKKSEGNAEANKEALLRYGSYTESKWIFVISRTITTGSETLVQIDTFTDNLTQLNETCKIDRTQADLIKDATGATIFSGIFKTETSQP